MTSAPLHAQEVDVRLLKLYQPFESSSRRAASPAIQPQRTCYKYYFPRRNWMNKGVPHNLKLLQKLTCLP